MEYRRRRRTAYSEGRTAANPAYYLAAVLFLTVAGLVGFSRPSTWLAERVLVPAFSGEAIATAKPTDDARLTAAAAATGAATESRTYVLPAYDCYALQIGVYEDEENARAQSAALQALGAAGRVSEDGGRYRVLASGYRTQADAKAVQQRLLTEGIESYVFPIRCAERAYTIRGDTAQIDVFCDAAAGVTPLIDELYAAMIAFDRESMQASEGLLAVRTARETCRAHHDALSKLAPDAGGQIAGLLSFYRQLYEKASEVADMEAAETVVLTARLKALYLHAAYLREALSTG